jgi:hypothetical protein
LTVYGIDSSDFDWARGSFDVAAMARDGIAFLTAKATESTGIKHVHYGEALQRARAAGIELLGAYHVVRSTDVAAQVRHGIDVPLWNANYGANQAGPYRELYPGDGSSRWAPYSGRAPMLLQFGSRATIGSQPGCDINAFRGTYEQLKALIEGDDVALSDDERAALFEVRDRLRWVDGRAAALADGTDTYVDPAGEAHPAALVKLVRDLAGGVQALSTRVESMAVGDVDYAALARAVADEQARRLES